MIWLLIFIVIEGYLLATHQEIIMYLKEKINEKEK